MWWYFIYFSLLFDFKFLRTSFFFWKQRYWISSVLCWEIVVFNVFSETIFQIMKISFKNFTPFFGWICAFSTIFLIIYGLLEGWGIEIAILILMLGTAFVLIMCNWKRLYKSDGKGWCTSNFPENNYTLPSPILRIFLFLLEGFDLLDCQWILPWLL